ncbi:hypothetical protein [Nonomuraea soli]|uniref:Uncharacterized protein n=1 Tax=Nonomuraea soli TaxID=1032476 RepID=A0A7W0HW02_9ACTN|nr:hypothetical protein [Nonomuraea soli]MBA2897759.1 hypothetical protein [Nonomuraea soli]
MSVTKPELATELATKLTVSAPASASTAGPTLGSAPGPGAPERAAEVSVRVTHGSGTYTLTVTGTDGRQRVEVVGVDEHGQVVAELEGVMSGDLSVLAQLFAAGAAAIPPAQRPPVTLEQRRARHANSHRPWMPEDDALLLRLAKEPGANIRDLMTRFGRSREAIVKRLERLGFDPKSLPSRA